MNTALKKKSLEESLSVHTAQVESESRVEVVGENKFKLLLNQYGEFLDKISGVAFPYWYEDQIEIYNPLLLKIQELLNPEEINRFLQMTTIYEDHPLYIGNTGIFISRLMSLDLHHSKRQEFDLNVENLELLSGLPMLLKSMSANKPLKVNIYGDVDHCVGADSQYTIFDIHGDVGNEAGKGSKHCQYIFRGKVGMNVGLIAENGTFTFLGQKKCELPVFSSDMGATYKFDNRDLADEIFDKVDPGNIVVYIHPNGREEVVRDYS